MDVLPTLDEDGKPVMAVKNSPVWTDLEGAFLAWCKRRLQFAGRETPEEFEFAAIQSAFRMQERELGRG
jgi:hypothetical protein